jgi:hypothetical protein
MRTAQEAAAILLNALTAAKGQARRHCSARS